ncbi:MAG: NCS2 family permease [Propionibacteriaceae bacterium]|jgi:AGZA family xanthine/uracil permease-like MFS transporter|nr:NCS2 family permease [Propionibacteriaceae bacterium]
MVQKSPRAVSTAPSSSSSPQGMDRFFKITSRGSTLAREFRGGLVTFFSMAYIIALNPIIIGTTADKNGNLISGLPLYAEWPPVYDEAGQMITETLGANIGMTMTMVAAATAVIAGVMSLLMGLIGRYPIAIAAGLGLNAFVAYGIAPMMTWGQAMGLIVWEGIIITILVLTKFRKAVMNAVPHSLRTAISVGIGLFIALIGLVDAGFVRQGSQMGELGIGGTIAGWPLLVFVIVLVGLVIMWVHRVKGAMLIAIVAGTILAVIVEAVAKVGDSMANPSTGWRLNVPQLAEGGSWLPNLELLKFWNHIDLIGAFSADFKAWIVVIMLILALMLADFFDTMGTIVAIGKTGNLLQKDGNPPRTQQILLVDSLAAVAGGLFSTSSNTSYIESASGVSDGARTGLASIVTGLTFLVAVFITPLVNLVPSEAVAPVLVVVGFLMLQQVTDIDWKDLEVAIPAFFMITMMPFTYSITVGMGLGFIIYLIIKLVQGKASKTSPLLWVIGVMFLIYFMQGLILNWLS